MLPRDNGQQYVWMTDNEVPSMKSAARIVGAALTLAAFIAMPFAQPAQTAEAATPADLRVEPGVFDRQGAGWDPTATAYKPKWIHVIFRLYNDGGSPTGSMLAFPYCKYDGEWMLAKPSFPVAPQLQANGSTTVWFDCYKAKIDGRMTWPSAAKLYVLANGEPASKRGNNQAEMDWPNLVLIGFGQSLLGRS